VSNTAALYYSAMGIVAASNNGSAFVANSGGIDVYTKYIGVGIDASGATGVDVANSGAITVDAWYGYGIRAIAGGGDVSVENSGSIDNYYSTGLATGYAWGILALTSAGDISVDNSGDISTYVEGQSVGIFARAQAGNVDVAHSGNIDAFSLASTAAGIFARTDDGSATVDIDGGAILAYSPYGVAYGVLGSATDISVVNDGDITAVGAYAAAGINVYGSDSASVSGSGDILAVSLYAARGANVAAGGDVSVDVSGQTTAVSYFGDAVGLYAYSVYGDVDVSNDGELTVVAPYGLADGIFASGANVSVGNGANGEIVAVGYDWAAGIEAQGTDSVSVSNAGSITAVTYGVSEAFGIYAASGDGGTTVQNDGAIYVRGYDQAVGINAVSAGDVDVTSTGAIYAGYYYVDGYGNRFSSSYASAILAMSGGEGANVSLDTSGDLYAVSWVASSGAEARSLGAGGTATLNNDADVLSVAIAYGGSAAGLVASADGDATIVNAGDILAFSGGTAYGAIALSFNGNASVSNAGDITSVNDAFLYYGAYGIVAFSQNGTAEAHNSGNIEVYTPYIGVGVDVASFAGSSASNSGDIVADAWVSYGMRATSGGGDVDIGNSGSIDAYYSGAFLGYSFGMLARTTGDISIENSGDITSDGGLQGVGIFATTSAGDISMENSGDVASSTLLGVSAGLFARATNGTAVIETSGDVTSDALYGDAYGVLARGAYLYASNSGDISANGYYSAYGAALIGTVYSTVENSGTITATTDGGIAVGVLAYGTYGATVSNSGTISAEAGDYGLAVGVVAQSYYDVLVENSGTITASHPDQAIAVLMESVAGTATLENSGTITTDTSVAGSIAVLGSDGANEVHNTGDIEGAIVTFDGDDLVHNGQGGTWHVHNFTTYLGGGDDAIVNGAGGTIHIANGGIFLGSSGAAGNSFVNSGTIHTSGYGYIDMGSGVSLVPSLNPLPLTNNGLIDFVDGAPDDMLVIVGDLGGDGAISVDLSGLNGASDLLYVDGSVVDGTTQAINVNLLEGLPTGMQTEFAPVVAVSGNTASNAFVGGQVLNVDPSNFLDFGVSVQSAQVGGVNVVSAAVDVTGLNDTGVLAASVAQGAHSLINSAIGTRNQRLGLWAPLDEGQAGISPWLRAYTDKGDLSPEASGFGSGADFGFEQENRGREAGIDFSFGNGFSFGLLAGNADGTQRLSGGAGEDRLKLHGTGLYATWRLPSFYVDVSYRWMEFDAKLTSAAGEQRANGDATAGNVEVGYTGWSMGGVSIVPQAQYTRSKIDNVGPVQGSLTEMALSGGVSERGRVGVALSRTFESGNGFRWTPYGAISAVREFKGETGFSVGGTFDGTTSVEGSGTLAELGIGLRKGGLSATAGFNWADGGAMDNVRGGQLVLRYTW
jgi:hypothetical protein